MPCSYRADARDGNDQAKDIHSGAKPHDHQTRVINVANSIATDN